MLALFVDIYVNVHIFSCQYCVTILVFCYYVNIGVVMFYLYYLLFTNLFCLLKLIENNKKRKYESSGVRCLKSYFGTNWLIFIIILSVLQFKLFDFYISMWLFQITILMRDSGLLFYDLSKKGFRGNFDSILDFLEIPKLKWILKWLPFDRGRFKFYFLQKEKVHW